MFLNYKGVKAECKLAECKLGDSWIQTKIIGVDIFLICYMILQNLGPNKANVSNYVDSCVFSLVLA